MEVQGTRRLGSGSVARFGRGLAVLAAAAGLAGRAGAATPAEWLVAGDGNWTDGTKWSTAPAWPDNGSPAAGAAYDVRIGAAGQAYTVWLNSAVRVDGVTVDSPDATLRFGGPGAVLETPVFRVDRGRVLFDGGGLVRGAMVSVAPGAGIRGGAFEDVRFAPELTLERPSAFNGGLTLDGTTLHLLYTEGVSSGPSWGTNPTIAGRGTIVADAEHGFERAQMTALGTTLTIGADVVLRTGTGNFDVGTRNFDVNGNASYVVNRGTVVAGTWLGAARTVNVTRAVNEGAISAMGGKLTAYAADNRGRIDVSGATGSATLDTFTNSGTVTVSGGASLTLLGVDNRGTIEVTGGRLTARDASQYLGSPRMWNPGRIVLRDTTLELGVPMTTDELGRTFERTGAKPLVVAATLDNTGRTLNVSPTDWLYVSSAGRIKGGVIAGAGGGVGANGWTSVWGVLDGVTLDADLDLAEGRTGLKVENGLTLANGATVRVGPLGSTRYAISMAGDQTLSGDGTILFDDPEPADAPELTTGVGRLTVGPGVTIATGAGNGWIGRYSAAGKGSRLLNRGTLRASGGRYLQIWTEEFVNEGVLDVSRGWIYAHGGRVSNTTGTISGGGAGFGGSVESGGVIDPGSAAERALLIFDGDVTLLSTNRLVIDLAADRADQVVVAGDAMIDGTLDVHLVGGFVPAVGQRFEFLREWDDATAAFTGPSAGAFATVLLPALPEGMSWDASAVDGGVLTVVPEPGGLGVLAAVSLAGAGLPRRRRPRRGVDASGSASR